MDTLYQYDLSAPNILSTEQFISTLTSPVNGWALQGYLKLAPDGKIYWSSMWYDGTFFFPYPDTTYNIYNTHLSVINQPNNLGTACDFQPFSFYLGGSRTYIGLPNNPNYDLGPLVGSICDSLTIGLEEQAGESSAAMVFPNPCSNKFTLALTGFTPITIEKIAVINTLGEAVKMLNADVHLPTIFDISDLPDGLYIVEVKAKEGRMACKVLKRK